MALLASTRREADVQSFPLLIFILVPLVALGLQSFVTLHFPRFDMIDLPLLVTVYFSIAWRNPIAGTVGGAILGIAQDALTHHPLGVFGICKALIGYLAGSLGVRIDTESHGTRLLVALVFLMVHDGIFWVLVRRLLAQPFAWDWLHELIRAAINALVGVVLFALLDLTKRRG